MSYGTQLPFQKGLHLRFHDLRRPHEENDEPLHPSRPPAIGTPPIILIGRCAGPKHRVPHAIRAVGHRRAHSRKPQVLLSIHTEVFTHCFSDRL